ncbi:MAG TPA: hypothetical protein PLR25_21515, partial [Planctomycetaceae bacterium]|nr:hypothetical protein [Planctomycetaceae bacterium]
TTLCQPRATPWEIFSNGNDGLGVAAAEFGSERDGKPGDQDSGRKQSSSGGRMGDHPFGSSVECAIQEC